MPHVYKIPENSPLTERHDPVTGDAFVVGSEVVFCAACRSAFLKESWAYMGNKHCKQRKTLTEIPKLETLSYIITSPEKDYFIFPGSLQGLPQKKLKAYIRKEERGRTTMLVGAILLVLNTLYFSVQIMPLMAGDAEGFSFFKTLGPFIASVLLLLVQYYWPYSPPEEKLRAFGKRFIHTTNKSYPYSDVKQVTVTHGHVLEQDTWVYRTKVTLKLKGQTDIEGRFDNANDILWAIRDITLEKGVVIHYWPLRGESREVLRKVQKESKNKIVIRSK